MRVHFHGAAGEVTGSLHEVEAAGRRVLLDCGMIQGSPEAERRNTDPFPFEPAHIDVLILSHAHIDHIGRVPLPCGARLQWSDLCAGSHRRVDAQHATRRGISSRERSCTNQPPPHPGQAEGRPCIRGKTSRRRCGL